MQLQTPTVIQLSLLDPTGDSFHRMRWPGRQLSLQMPSWRVINLDFRAAERFSWGLEAELLVLLHCGDIDLIPLIEQRRARGKRTLIEINDNFYSPQPWNVARKAWSSPLVWKMYERLIAAADGVIVTGPGLAELLKEKAAGKIFTLENHFPEELPPFEQIYKNPSREIALGWAGSAGHMADLMYAAPVIREVLQKYPQVKLHLMGDETIPNFFRLPPQRLRFIPFGAIQAYFKFWETVDLAFIPLLDTAYNRCRSDIKAVEIAGQAVLPILQEGVPYRTFVEKTGAPTFSNLDELKKHLISFIENPTVIRERAEKCFHYVKSERIGIQRKERLELYAKMLEGTPSSNYAWKMPAGFHEVSGTPSQVSPQQQTLAQVQGLWTQKKQSEAQVILRSASEKQPYNSEFAIAELKLLEAQRSKDLSSAVVRMKKQFPEDLRIALFEIKITTNREDRLKLWRNVADQLRVLPQALREFFRATLVPTLISDLQSIDGSLAVADEIAEFYPASAELRWQLALAAELAGENKLAYKHFRWLADRKSEFDDTKNFFDHTPDYILEVWSAATDARLGNKSS
jgi:hypothetical protein